LRNHAREEIGRPSGGLTGQEPYRLRWKGLGNRGTAIYDKRARKRA
jgi:hypothetical protein